jgi:hypothetical protein
MCAKGDDPETVDQNPYRFSVTVIGQPNLIYGHIGLYFEGRISNLLLTDSSNTQCINSLMRSGSYRLVDCEYSSRENVRVFNITVHSWPYTPVQNNIFSHNGAPPLNHFHCDTSRTSAVHSCAFELHSSSFVSGESFVTRVGCARMFKYCCAEYAYCSNRGICDFSKGICTCNNGFAGSACENATELTTHIPQTNALPYFEIDVDNPLFTSAAMSLETLKPPAPDFHFVEASTSDTSVAFGVQSDGTVYGTSFVTAVGTAGQAVTSGGLYIASGGLTVNNDALNVVSNASRVPVALIAATNEEPENSSSVLTASSLSKSTSHYLLQALHEHVPVFSVRATGRTDIKGGLEVASRVTVNNKGLRITNGKLTVASEGLQVDAGGLYVRSGLTILSGGMRIGTNGMMITTGATVLGGGLKVNAGGQSVHGGIMVSDGITVKSSGIHVMSAGIQVTGGMTVTNTGLFATGGATITAGQVFSSGTVVVTIASTVDTGSALTVGGEAVLFQTLRVVHSTSLGQSLSVANAVSFGASLDAVGNIQVANSGLMSSTLNVAGGVTVHNLVVSGPVTISGNLFTPTGSVATSDRRLKMNVEAIQGPLAKVKALRGVYFKWASPWQDNKFYDDQRHIGLMAQNVQQTVPEAVAVIGDGKYLGVDYPALVPVLVEALRELDDMIHQVDSKCNDLDSKISHTD